MIKLILLVLCVFHLYGSTICLNMIVKDEAPVIKRCLESVKPLIDHWVIVDTGSSDETIKIIRETLQGIPGELYERPWHNFEVNRNEALNLAKGKGDYVLFIDADEEFIYDKAFQFPKLDKDFYLLTVKNESDGKIVSEYLRTLLINNKQRWAWKGVIHEDIYCSDAKTSIVMPGIYNVSRTQEGARAQDPQKYLKDAHVLEKALQQEPGNSRYVFYLAVSYYNAGKLQEALTNFQKRVDLEPEREGSDEIYNSLYFIACLQAALGADQKTVIDSFTRASLYNPLRSEPLYQLGSYLIDRGELFLADLVLSKGLSIPMPIEPQGKGFLFTWVYDWGMLHKFAECAFKLGRYQVSKRALETLVTKPLPAPLLEAMKSNLDSLHVVPNSKDTNPSQT